MFEGQDIIAIVCAMVSGWWVMVGGWCAMVGGWGAIFGGWCVMVAVKMFVQ
jgi:hypothetical protein